VKLSEVEERLGAIGDARGSDFLFELLVAYGLPEASIKRLRSGSYDKSDIVGEHLWKGKVWYRSADLPNEELYLLIDGARADERVQRERPRFLVATNGERLLAIDTKTEGTLDIEPSELVANASFFLPWAGIEKTELENVNVADIKAAEKMARLYDEITKHNSIAGEEQAHELNVFFSRLLFCFFAEDTGVFSKGVFTNAIGSLTSQDGSDMSAFFDRLFELLDTEVDKRTNVTSDLRELGYVNGNLFRHRHTAPQFSARARSLILECGTLDWSQINPDIFGSMMQAVVTPSQREGLGMHYTSVENIMKVIRPLFLDELEEALEAADTVRKLENLRKRLSAIQIFDPACGSGNFLVIAYKELRRLEHEILRRIRELEPHRATLFAQSDIDLQNFYGIEIDDFAHEIAILSLWLAKHQMNMEFEELFGAEIPLIPLVEAGQVTCGNAARLDWTTLCAPGSVETYVLGNPPYVGSSMQSAAQKRDFIEYFGTSKYPKNLDYISLWFFKGAEYITASGSAALGFVSTNSISQGDHTGLMWPRVLDSGVKVSFAYQSFAWSNSARGKAGVTCVIVGLRSASDAGVRVLYSDGRRQVVDNINPYLRPDPRDTIVHAKRGQVSGLPPMLRGSQPTDGGYLNLTESERCELIQQEPAAERFIRPYIGSSELLSGLSRYCLWIRDDEATVASSMPAVAERLMRVADFRRRGSTTAQAMVDRPHRFLQRPHKDSPAIIVPRVCSERRDYVPMGFVDGSTVVSDAANAIYDAEPWLFGVLHSRMHMAWVRAVAGRLESRYRYSAVLVYNTFPVPPLTDEDKTDLTRHAVAVLAAREQYPDRTLAELYDPEKMPDNLREAHRVLDGAVDAIYSSKPFASDDDRLRLLFEMYEEAIAREPA
jgi:hypothetical protein